MYAVQLNLEVQITVIRPLIFRETLPKPFNLCSEFLHLKLERMPCLSRGHRVPEQTRLRELILGKFWGIEPHTDTELIPQTRPLQTSLLTTLNC